MTMTDAPTGRQSRDLDGGHRGGGGSGAIDPLSAGLVVAVTALALGSSRRRRNRLAA
jgi:hypothetical protein